MTITNADLEIFLTGGSSNSNPALSLGGNVSSVRINNNQLNNLFRRITDSEASSGVTLYRCVAIKNKNTLGDEARNVAFYMVYDTKSLDSLSLYSLAQAGKNVTETPVANEFTSPTGSNINFIAALNRSGGLKLGHIDANEFRCVWLKYVAQPGSEQFANDEFKMRVECDDPNATGTPSTGGGPTPEPNPTTGVNFQMAVLGDCSCSSSFSNMWNRIKNRGPEFVVFNGDLAYKSGSKCFVDLTSGWRSKSRISFGNHDVDEGESQPETKNALKNAWSLSKTYYRHTFNNVGMIFMEAGENQSVSSSSGSSQYNDIKSWLSQFDKDAGIEWIVVFNHYPIYGPESDHDNESDVRDDYDPLFDQFGVDAVFTSHNHNLWHSKLLKYNSGSPNNPTTAGTDPNYSYKRSADNHGKFYIGSGAGGKSHHNIDSTPSYVMYTNDNDYGYCWMEQTNNGKKFTFKFYTSNDTLKKTWSLTHT